MRNRFLTLFGLIAILMSANSWGWGTCPKGIETFECQSVDARFSFGGDFVALRQTHATPKKFMVFFDGTANAPLPPHKVTNVWRLYQNVSTDTQTVTLYVEGVGSEFEKEFTDKTKPDTTKTRVHEIASGATGAGMEARVKFVYKFLAENYMPNDQVYLFGFSRGAIQARYLAGMLASVGLPTKVAFQKEISNKEIDDIFASAKPNGNETEDIIFRHPIKTTPIKVNFLGVWDSVIGIPAEEITDEVREKYKLSPYPNILHIAHALAIDEKRSRFAPILIGDAIAPNSTIIEERWFPGAHADVGGGYGGSEDGCADGACTELPDISLAWMIKQLGAAGYRAPQMEIKGKPGGVAHWSYQYSAASSGSTCVDRDREKYHITDANTDESYRERINSKSPQLAVMNPNTKTAKPQPYTYPCLCSETKCAIPETKCAK